MPSRREPRNPPDPDDGSPLTTATDREGMFEEAALLYQRVIDGLGQGEAEQFIRDQARPAGHLVGSCKMGASDDPAAVVDSACRLNGIPRVRVVDGSILPQIPYGSPQGTIMAVAERAAALILGER